MGIYGCQCEIGVSTPEDAYRSQVLLAMEAAAVRSAWDDEDARTTPVYTVHAWI